MVAKAIEMASPLLEQRQHTLDGAACRDAACWSMPTITRLSQVVSNLLTNAAKYTPPGGHITVRGERRRRRGGRCRVRDNGIGIAPELLPRVFDLFVQERQAIDRAQGGLGLGLTIVRNLVELHGGTVAARRATAPGRGSEFIVRLPRATCGGAERVRSERSSRCDRTAGPKDGAPRVLVVDDNEDAAEMLVDRRCSQKGTTRACAHDGPAALEHCRGRSRPTSPSSTSACR